MRLLSRLLFGDYFKYERTFNGDMGDLTKRLSKVFEIKGIKGTIGPTVKLTWDEKSQKFQFTGTLTEDKGKTKLIGEFVLARFHTIRYLIWFLFWSIGYILWELGQIEFEKGEETFFLTLIIIGLIMFIIFLIRINIKAKEIVETIDNL